MRAGIALLALALIAADSAEAQGVRTTASGSMGLAVIGDGAGFSFALGPRFNWRSFTSIAALDMIATGGTGDDRYYWDELSNGQRRCRDSATGQFADSSNCGGEVLFAAMADVAYELPIGSPDMGLVLGVGFRAGHATTPYGVAGLTGRFAIGLPWFARLLVGDGYGQGHFGISLP